MEETLKEIAPALVQLESDTAVEIVRQVLIFKYVEMLLMILLTCAMFWFFYKLIKSI
jgi:hypothetical protein